MQASAPARSADPVLAASALACRRGDRVLFRNVSFTLNTGEALHLAGPNGIGKSSLIRILAGLMPPFAGTVERLGAMALLDERNALDPQLPLGAALSFWQAIDRTGDSAFARAVARLGLADLLDVPVRYLSTGQKKRAALVRVIGQNAPVWLLDEPLNGLDRGAVALVEALVAEHCAAGGIAVIASHQPVAVAAMARFELEGFAL